MPPLAVFSLHAVWTRFLSKLTLRMPNLNTQWSLGQQQLNWQESGVYAIFSQNSDVNVPFCTFENLNLWSSATFTYFNQLLLVSNCLGQSYVLGWAFSFSPICCVPRSSSVEASPAGPCAASLGTRCSHSRLSLQQVLLRTQPYALLEQVHCKSFPNLTSSHCKPWWTVWTVCCGNTSISLPGGELCLSTVFYSVWCLKKKVTEHWTSNIYCTWPSIIFLT